VNAKRSSLAPSTVDKVVFIHENATLLMTTLNNFNTSSDMHIKAYKLLKQCRITLNNVFLKNKIATERH